MEVNPENIHKLLARQIRKNEIDSSGLNEKLVSDISQAYVSYEEKIKLLENIIEVSQKELLKANSELRRITLEQELIIEDKIKELSETNSHLVETKNKMLTIFDSVEEAIISTSLNGIITFASPNISKVLSFKFQNLNGIDILSFFSKLGLSAGILSELQINYIQEVELAHSSSFFSITQNKDFKEKGFLVYTFRNITKDKESARQLKNQKDFYENILENMPADIALFSRDHRYIYLNSKAIKDPERRAIILGKTDLEYAEALGRDPQFAIERMSIFQEAVRSKKIIEFDDRIKTPEGKTKIVHRQFNPFLKPDFQEDYVMGFGIDITELLETQEKLRENEKQLRLVMESSHDAIFALDENEQVIFFNSSCKNIFEWENDEIQGRRFDELLVPVGGEKLSKLIDSKTADYSKRFFELGLKTKRGKKLVIELNIISVLTESNQSIFICFGRDITDQKIAERKIKELNNNLELKVQERTRELQIANKEMELFSYSVSHDLKSPLRAITGYANILEEDYNTNLDSEGQHFLSEVIRNANRMSHLIDSLLSFSRLGKKEVRKINFDLDELVKSVIHDLTPFENPHSSISMEPLGSAYADPDLIRQVFSNLIGNALKYSSKKEIPLIQISASEGELETTIKIADNGAGFNMDYYDKLFGVFQRLHSDKEFQGTGVGLALTQKIITKHGGRIWANSEQHVGSVFFFTLPKNTANEFLESD